MCFTFKKSLHPLIFNFLFQFFEVNSCTPKLLDTITDFVSTISSQKSVVYKEMSFKAFTCLILNFELHYCNQFSIIESIIQRFYQFISDDRIMALFKEKHKTEYLFYVLNKYFNIRSEFEGSKFIKNVKV